MSKINKSNLEYLGFDFQRKLCLQLITDKKFTKSIIDIIQADYFHDPFLKQMVVTLKDAYEKHSVLLDFSSLEARLLESISNEKTRTFIIPELNRVKEASSVDYEYVQETAMKFCKHNELNKSIKEIQGIIDKGDIDNYEQCEKILRKALDFGQAKDDGIDVLSNLDEVLAEDFRDPIPTGIKGLDEIMNGGLSKGELGVVLAALGVGKTTLLTKFANTAKDNGKNVVQIFFEDMPMVIQRKHLACWSGIDLNDLPLHKERLKELAVFKESQPGVIKLKKFSSNGTTMPMIYQYLKRLIAQGFKPDMILLDYIDCVSPSKHVDDINIGEGNVMREFESMLSELDIAGWTAIQGNRSSIRADIVEADQMGGSIKKAQIGHFIVSVSRTLDQKNNGTATMAILKSRFGKDGMVYPNITFNNSKLIIEMDENKPARTQADHKKDGETENQNYLNALMSANSNRKATLTNGLNTGTTETTEINNQ